MSPSPTAAAHEAAVSLTNCDTEPIHIPGAIQPYGFLLCLDLATHLIVQASENTAAQVGVSAAELLGQPLGRLLGPGRAAEVAALLPSLTAAPRLLGTRLEGVAGAPFYKLILHCFDGLLWLEFEPVAETDASAALDLPRLNEALGQLLAADGVLALCELAAEQVRAISGFDRVAIYRFAPDDSGEVVAEATAPGLPPWLGLRYPAADIPQQARALYLKNWLRFIPDAGYRPVRLVPACPPGHARPPDMTHAVLRSVSPIHLEYLHNLGSAATMTISLIEDGRLWGMITCHHRTPRLVSYELRDLCQFIGKTFSALLKTKQLQDGYAYRLGVQARQGQLLEQAAAQPDLRAALTAGGMTLAGVFDCGGAAMCLGEQATCACVGTTPPAAELHQLLGWLRQHAHGEVFRTHSLAAHDAALGQALRTTAAGVLAVRLAPGTDDFLLWVRPEQMRTVTWAGQNEKSQQLASGQLFLSPRQSFEAWKQTVELTAAPWLDVEVEAAVAIRQFVADQQLRTLREVQARAEALLHLNAELERSNDELDAFAYVASHDLKEPLRGIHNYSVFLLEDYASKLDDEATQRLRTLVRLSQRMEGLIEGLLQLARAGRQELSLERVDLNGLLAEVLDLLHLRLLETHTQVTVAPNLPAVQGDRVRVMEIFNNLIANATKYNDRPTKHVQVGLALAGTVPVASELDLTNFHLFFVQDDGIGIDARHHDSIFKLFKRLHGQDKYGGGTGAGLAIARRMVERQGGSIWVESARGQGATFYFSLPKAL
ncbi:MAG: ATP-binding protein [Janthinobacterium lividum]